MYCTALVACLLVVCTVAQDFQQQQTVEVKEMGGALTLNCSNQPLPAGDRASHWILLDLSTMYPNHTNPNKNVRVSADGSQLLIAQVGYAHLGDYICAVNGPTSKVYYLKTRLAAMQLGLWEKYKTNTMIGGIAGAATLVLLTLFCVVHHYRWTPREESHVHHHLHMYDSSGVGGARSSVSFASEHDGVMNKGFVDNVTTISVPSEVKTGDTKM